MDQRNEGSLDDERPSPEGWMRVYWPHEGGSMPEAAMDELLSLDHDLAGDGRGTGNDVTLCVEREVFMNGVTHATLLVRSVNPAAALRMKAGVAAGFGSAARNLDVIGMRKG